MDRRACFPELRLGAGVGVGAEFTFAPRACSWWDVPARGFRALCLASRNTDSLAFDDDDVSVTSSRPSSTRAATLAVAVVALRDKMARRYWRFAVASNLTCPAHETYVLRSMALIIIVTATQTQPVDIQPWVEIK